MNSTFLTVIETLGTLAFAISGIRMAAAKRFDWFGAYVVGLVTAIGGGTIRDLLLGLTPFWMVNGIYLTITGVSLLLVIIFSKYLIRLSNTFFIFDTIGLGLFVVVGMEKTLGIHHPFWVAIVMATISGAAGGVIRDILINELPLIFRTDIYALACVFGGLVYWFCYRLGLPHQMTQLLAAGTVVAARLIAVKYKLGLPNLSADIFREERRQRIQKQKEE